MAYQSDNALEIEGLTNKEIDHAIFYNPNSGRPDHRRILRCGDRRSDFIRPIFSVISLPVSAISLVDAPVLYEKELRKAREIAFEELGSQARALGADAVVGIDIDYETVGQNGSMLMVSVSGTAVKTRR